MQPHGFSQKLDVMISTTMGRITRAPISYLHAIVFLLGFLIVFSRRPDAILNAQFWAEDGKYWYADAYSFGWHSLVMPEAGYLHLLPRLAALLSLLFPLAIAPLVMNLCAIVFQIFPVNLFLSSRFGSIALETRLFSCLLYLAVPNSFEIHANATNIQWHFALIGCMVLLSQPQINLTVGRQIFDLAALALVSLDSPVGMLLIPIAGIVWWQRKDNPSKWSILALIPGSLLQIMVILFSTSRRPASNGASLARLTSILGGQVFLSSILGKNTFVRFYFVQHLSYLFVIEAISAAIGLAVIIYALCCAPKELKLFILFAALVLSMALRRPLASLGGEYQQWELMQVPGMSNRYYFLPMLAFLASLIWMLYHNSAASKLPRFAAIGLFKSSKNLFGQ